MKTSIFSFIAAALVFLQSLCVSASSPVQEASVRFPVLNFKEYSDGDPVAREKFVLAVGEALHNFGFFALINHGIPQETIDEAYKQSKAFFSLPIQVKKRYESIAKNRGFKGFNPNREDKTPDLQEYWHVGRECIAETTPFRNIQGNVWPEEIEEFKPSLLKLYQEADVLSGKILEASALSFGEQKDFLKEKADNGDSILRVIHYQENFQEGDGLVWKAEHKDPNVLTLIIGISSEGLEIKRPDGSWMQVPLIKDALIVSASNMLEHISNGYLKSTPHRVMNTNKGSRYSIPFFVHFRRDVILNPSEKAVERTGGVPLYSVQTVEEALKDRDWFQKAGQK